MMTLLIYSVLVTGQSNLRLNPLFSDGMVLQRSIGAPVFGFAEPGAFVQVEIAGQRSGATADKSGRWLTRLKPLAAGGPLTMSVSSNGQTVNVRDILVGEVWICSGQSNMEWTASNADDYVRAQSETKPEVRMFTVQKATAFTPSAEVRGSWDAASPTTIGHFSAVGLSFARELNKKLGVPVGMIHTSWGGTNCESWISKGALAASPNLKHMTEGLNVDPAKLAEEMEVYQKQMDIFINGKAGRPNEGFEKGWANAEFNDSSWDTVPALTTIEKALGKEWDGAFWYRKTVSVPESWYGKELTLELGAIDDYDITYFDGIRVGLTNDRTENAYAAPRKYKIAPGIVRRGSNTISVRVFDTGGAGGFTGPASAMKLSLADGSESIALDGDWKLQVEKELDHSKPRPVRPVGEGNPNVPTSLYNAMIAPLVPYGIKGAIWYQGENNAGRAFQYREVFPTMIRDWRAKWQQGNFPFYFVQLANFMARNEQPVESAWAELREAQSMTQKLPNTGMAVIIDIGEANDIHPRNKREVGRRLSLWALGQTYRVPMAYASPAYQGITIQSDKAIVSFANGSLATSDGRPVRGFSVAGEDRKFYWAEGRIEGSSVVLTSPNVPKPVAVRYGWSDNPDVNLVNRAGLPASPFRTDTWPGITINNR